MTMDFDETDITIELVFDRFIGGDDLDRIGALLGEVAPLWSEGLRIWSPPDSPVPVDLSIPHSFADAVLVDAGYRGPTYEELVEKHGVPAFERFFGASELRGAGPELIVIVSIDEMVVSPMGRKRRLGNKISFQVRGSSIEGQTGPAWARSVMERSCELLVPAWGAAYHQGDYWSKVMSSGRQIAAVGRDFDRYLPGLFWLNFFGRPHVNLLGTAKLAGAPNTRPLGDGFLTEVADEPSLWADPATIASEQQIRELLGYELFYDKANPDQTGLAPDW